MSLWEKEHSGGRLDTAKLRVRDNDFAPFSIIRDKLGNGQFGGDRRSSSGSLAKFTAICRASSRVSRFGRRAVRRSDMSEIGGEAEVRGLRPKRR